MLRRKIACGSKPGVWKRQTSAELGEDGFHPSHFWNETSNFNTRLTSQMRSEDSLLHLLGSLYFYGLFFKKMMFLLI